MCRVGKVVDVDEPDEDTDNGNDLGEQVAEIVKFALEWCLFGCLARNGGVDIANGGPDTGGSDDRLSRSINNSRSL